VRQHFGVTQQSRTNPNGMSGSALSEASSPRSSNVERRRVVERSVVRLTHGSGLRIAGHINGTWWSTLRSVGPGGALAGARIRPGRTGSE
jgi:hypothetical protein